MMIHAYQEMYIETIRTKMAEAFDYAINKCNIIGNDFINFFLASKTKSYLEKGIVTYFLGKSGIEIALDIINEIKDIKIEELKELDFYRTKEYWIGWAITYYQWYTNKKFERIFESISYDELLNLYDTLHEADILKFVEALNNIIDNKNYETNLKIIRSGYGISQNELAKRSNVSLRSIQMYEQRKKDINKASALTLYSISLVLGCNIEDLLEF